jgi:ribosomal protein S1
MRGFLVVLVLLIVLVVGFGFYRGWFSLSTADDLRRDELNVALKVDKGKVKSDAEAARESARHLGDDAKKAIKDTSKTETISGTVAEVRPDRITVKQADGMEVSIVRKEEAGQTTASEAKVGDRVQVVCVTEDGQRVARSISVERP